MANVTLGNLYHTTSSTTSNATYNQTDTIVPTNGENTNINYQVAPGVNIAVNVTAAQMFQTVPQGATSNLRSTLQSAVSNLSEMATAVQNKDNTGYQAGLQNLQSDLSNLTANLNNVVDLNSELGSNIKSLTSLQSQMTQYVNTLTN